MGKPGATGLRRIIDASRYSMQGLKAALRHESAFRQELALSVVMLPAALWLGQNAIEHILLIGSILLLLIVELLNSAIEAVVDRTGDDLHELSGRAKDMGSAAVLLSLVTLGLVWGLLLYQKFIA